VKCPTASDGVTGPFSSIAENNLPSGFHTSLNTADNNAYLNLVFTLSATEWRPHRQPTGLECELGRPANCSDACARLKVVDDCRRLDGLRDFAEMAVMGEVDHLSRGGHAGE
jgi:hypothetical protein